MPLAAIALGSNLGARRQTIASAISALSTVGGVIALSPLVETAPVGIVDQPDFLNGAALLQTHLPPLQLLQELLRIEREHGRDRAGSIAKGPRTLDLDLLLYDQVTMATPELTLPHPEMHRRLFVLEPLAAIAPTMQHPVLRQTVAQLLASLQSAVY